MPSAIEGNYLKKSKNNRDNNTTAHQPGELSEAGEEWMAQRLS